MGSEITQLLKFFDTNHLPSDLQDIVAQFAALAHTIANGPVNCQTVVSLQKLLESKNAAADAAMFSTSGGV
jgi:hypothetical protein